MVRFRCIRSNDRIRLNRIRKTVSFETVDVDSEFFCVCVQRSRQDENHLSLFSKRSWQNHAKFFRASSLLLPMENHRKSLIKKCNLSVTELNGFDKFWTTLLPNRSKGMLETRILNSKLLFNSRSTFSYWTAAHSS